MSPRSIKELCVPVMVILKLALVERDGYQLTEPAITIKTRRI